MNNIWLSSYKERCCEIDWNSLLGDTIKERIESVYALMTLMYHQFQGSKIVTSATLGSMFETSCRGFYPDTYYNQLYPDRYRRLYEVSVPFYIDKEFPWQDRMHIETYSDKRILIITNFAL